MSIQTIDDLRHYAEANFGNFGYLREIPKQLVREVDSALIVEDKVLPVHRFVLITSSPVFSEILSSNSPDSGSTSCVVKIPLIGTAEKVTKMALYFMYERYARHSGEDPCTAVDVAEQLAEWGHKYDAQVVLNVADRSFVQWLNASDASSSQATIVGLASTIVKVTKLAETFDLTSTISHCQSWLVSNFHRYPPLYSELLQLRRDTMVSIFIGLSKRLACSVEGLHALMTVGFEAQDAPVDQYLDHSRLQVYVTDVLRLLGQDEATNAQSLLCEYFCAVAKGQHTQGREFAYIASTFWNRQSFLCVAKELNDHISSHTDALSLQDLHSLILLLCPDMPLRVTRSAFKAATPLLPFGAAVPQGLGDVLKLSFAKMWTSLEITFLFEHFLLELRRLAFDGKSHLFKTPGDICKCMTIVSQLVDRSGWPCIPDNVLQEVMESIPESDEASGIHFDALVRGLCNSKGMQGHLQDMRESAVHRRQNARIVIDAALQSLVSPKLPLTDRTNISGRRPSLILRNQSMLDVVSFRVDDDPDFGSPAQLDN